MSGSLASRTVDDSRTTMTEIVMPEDTNHHGNIFGGRVLALIDKASAIAAMRHCHAPVVTAAIDRVDFLGGAREGSILILEAILHAAFHTSMEVGVSVHAEDPMSGARHSTCRALVTLVAVDPSGRPMAVPSLVARTDEEAAIARAAAERRERRKTHG